MKPRIKIGSFLMAVVMIFSVLFVTGCTPISLEKEWSYKTADKELAIGVYIYSLNAAYQQAKNYASELEDYDATNDKWLSLEITDDDGTKEVASKWIKDQAKLMCLSYLVMEEQLKAENVEIATDDMANAKSQAETYWTVGPYASYGYVMPQKDELEKYGVSFESYLYCTTEYNVKAEALFKAFYDKDGSKAVSDEDLKKFFCDEYVDYSYFTTNLYTSTTDEAGQSSNVALSEKEAKKVTDKIDSYAEKLNKGESYDDVIESYMKAEKIEEDPSTSNIEQLEKSSAGEEIKKAVEKLDNNKATTVKVGEGESAVYYLIYKRDIKDAADDYLKESANRDAVLAAMKNEEFTNDIKKLTETLKYEENTSVINKYDPKMFFIPEEPTTAAEDSEEEKDAA